MDVTYRRINRYVKMGAVAPFGAGCVLNVVWKYYRKNGASSALKEEQDATTRATNRGAGRFPLVHFTVAYG